MKIAIIASAACAAAFSLAMREPAHAGTVVVPASASIWLAGQPSGVSVAGYFSPPDDTAPSQSPIELQVTAPTLTFSATGDYSVDGSCFNTTAAGGCYSNEGDFSPSPWSGDYSGPDALVGIFLKATPTIETTTDGYEGPSDYVPGPDYTDPTNTAPGIYSPALDQIFYIGTGSGDTFVAPTGATEVYLGVADALGGSSNNVDAITVSFTGAVSAAPEPSTWLLMFAGVGIAGALLRRGTRAYDVRLSSLFDAQRSA